MYIQNPACEILDKAAFLIVKKYTSLFSERILQTIATYPNENLYAIPTCNKKLETMPIKYQGTDREPIQAGFDTVYVHNENKMASHTKAEHAMYEQWKKTSINLRGLNHFDFQLTSLQETLDVLQIAEQESPNVYEIIWVQLAGNNAPAPNDFILAGYDVSFFPEGSFSAICDCMCIPRWHGTDDEGELFKSFFLQLNQHGLFKDAETALAFLHHYQSFDWTEQGEYQIVEVWLR